MSRRKVIGVTPNLRLSTWDNGEGSYCHSIVNSGGLPVLLPPVEEDEHIEWLLESCDGFLFTGGIDIHPKYFGEEIWNNTVEINDKRDKVELKLIKRLIEENKPILAICRGIQVLNVALGGTLYQDLPTQLNLIHRQKEPGLEWGHGVNIVENTPFYNLFKKKRIKTNTSHHQSIKDLGEGLSLMATADDGVVEAVYMPNKKYVIGVQWHPESLSHISKDHKAIFDDFIKHC